MNVTSMNQIQIKADQHFSVAKARFYEVLGQGAFGRVRLARANVPDEESLSSTSVSSNEDDREKQKEAKGKTEDYVAIKVLGKKALVKSE